jgi:hypothetical protein
LSARRIIDTETTKILSDSSLIGYGGCASCHGSLAVRVISLAMFLLVVTAWLFATGGV